MKPYLMICGLLLSLGASLANAKSLQEYVPVLPEVLNKRLDIDPQVGYLVKEIKPDVYLMTDGIWQSVFVKTGQGVVLIDAPQSFGQHIKNAVGQITSEPIKKLVYTHSHVDHIGGSIYLKDIPNLEIVSSEIITHELKAKKDPRRLVPTKSFADEREIDLANSKLLLKDEGRFHSDAGSLSAYFPEKKLLMVIDVLAPGYVPFKNFDLTSNPEEYLAIFDKILEYDFDTFVGGHLSHIGSRDDVIQTKKYVEDVHKTVKRIHKQTDQMKIMSSVAEKIGWDNKYVLFKIFLDTVTQQCASEIESRWIDKLAGVDVWSNSHCETLLIYVRWDE